MNKHYYLMNGENGKGYAVNLLVNGVKTKEFTDIAALDLKTLEIKKDEAVNILSEYNNNLSKDFYNIQYPYKKIESKGFIPMFKYDNEKTKEIENNFRYFAEERIFHLKNHDKLKLFEGTKFNDYIEKLLYDILINSKSSLLSYESIMSASIKDLLISRYDKYQNKGTLQFIKSNIYRLRNQLSNYTELRNLTIEYLLWLQGIQTKNRSYIRQREKFDNYVNNENFNDNQEYRQMSFEDYINNPKLLQKTK